MAAFAATTAAGDAGEAVRGSSLPSGSWTSAPCIAVDGTAALARAREAIDEPADGDRRNSFHTLATIDPAAVYGRP